MTGPFHLTPSAIARHFHFDCDRYLRFAATPREARAGEGVPRGAYDDSPLMADVMESGLDWEREVVTGLLAGRVSIPPGDGDPTQRKFTPEQTLEHLRAETPDRFIYQGCLVPPAPLYAELGLSRSLVHFGECRPDLIEVREGDGKRLLRVIDIKRGEAVRLVHRVQVMLYVLVLDAVLAEAGITDAEVDFDTGGVWLGGAAEYEPFDLRPLRPFVEYFLRHRLPAVLARPAAEASWHVCYSCEQCGYLGHCRSQMRADDDVSRLTNLTAHGKRHLVGQRATTLPLLRDFLARPDADDVLGRCASLAGERSYIEGRLESFTQGRAVPHGSAAPLPIGENVAVFLHLQREPLGGHVYLAGLLVHAKAETQAAFSPALRARLFPDGKARPLAFLADSPDGVRENRNEFVRTLHAVLRDVHRFNDGKEWASQLTLQAYAHTARDAGFLTEWLLACLDEPGLAHQAMSLLLYFQCPDLMLADDHPGDPVPLPVVVLQNVLTKTVALPVEVSYTLPEVLQALGSAFSYRRSAAFHYPLSNAMRSEPVHAAWHQGETARLAEIRSESGRYLFALRALLWAVRGVIGEHLFAWPARFALPSDMGINDPILSRLAFFTRYESVVAFRAVREAREETPSVQMRQGLCVELEARGETLFDVVGEPALDLDESGFASWLLARDGEPGRRAQLSFRDYAHRARFWMKQSIGAAMAGIAHADETDGIVRQVRLKYATKFDGAQPLDGERYRLHPRFTDFNSDRVIDFLKALDARGGGLFAAMVRDPEGAARSLPLPVPATAEGLTDSQQAAFREICKRRVVAVWGPPGTGKTHFLAVAILALARAHRDAGLPFRVLVTAFTHAAIENVLRKIAQVRPAGDPLPVAKAKEWKGEEAGDTVLEERLAGWLRERAVAVVGATVYACLKAGKKAALQPFDLVVIDEASQVRVAEASIPCDLVGPKGRLVLAGDDLQLPPVVQGVYPDPIPGEPTLHRSIFEAVRSRVGAPIVRQLLENRRMNDVLTSFARYLYGPLYRCFDASVASRRLTLADGDAGSLVEACLRPDEPLVLVVLRGVQAASENAVEAELVADVVMALRERMGYADDAAFWRDGVFVVSPHRAQNRATRRELARRREWASPPFVDTVDKMQGQEADAVVISYGVADPEYAVAEAEFIYNVNRLNVAITRARRKSVVFLSEALLDSLPQVLDMPEAERGLAFMRYLVGEAERQAQPLAFVVPGGEALVYRAGREA